MAPFEARLSIFMNQTPVPEAIRSAITAKCGAIVSLSLSWESAVRKALAAEASPEAVVAALENMQSCRNFESLLAGLAQEGAGLDSFLGNVRGRVDESNFDLASWVASFEEVQAYLVDSSRSATPSSILGYIKCSADLGERMNPCESLLAVVRGMLDQYGFEGQQGCGTDPLG